MELDEVNLRLTTIESRQVDDSERLKRLETKQQDDSLRFGTYCVEILKAVRDVSEQIGTQQQLTRFEERLAALERAMGGFKP